MKKNGIIVLLMLIILGLGGYLVYDKVLNNDSKVTENSGETINQTNDKREVYEYVDNAFSGIAVIDWPESPKWEEGDPKEIVIKADIPKILIDTEVTKNINKKIYDKYSETINNIKTKKEGITNININYDYRIDKNILFILIQKQAYLLRGSGSDNYEVYYYDISNDKELNVNEICNIYNITLDEIKSRDASASKIYAVMPTNSSHYDVYYEQDESCPSFGCTDIASYSRYLTNKQ